MKPVVSKPWWLGALLVVWALAAAAQPAQPAQPAPSGSVVYRCPGNLYTGTIGAKEAKDKGCQALEGAPVTVIQGPKPRATEGRPAASSPPGSRVDPADQRARDSDARRILEAELRREEDRLVQMRAEFNNGEPERQGNERNFQKYQERVADMKSAIVRKEGDIAALKREVAKHPQ